MTKIWTKLIMETLKMLKAKKCKMFSWLRISNWKPNSFEKYPYLLEKLGLVFKPKIYISVMTWTFKTLWCVNFETPCIVSIHEGWSLKVGLPTTNHHHKLLGYTSNEQCRRLTFQRFSFTGTLLSFYFLENYRIKCNIWEMEKCLRGGTLSTPHRKSLSKTP